MAVPAYARWLALGKPLDPAQPIAEFVGKAKAAWPRAANTFGWWADDAHYQAVPAEDHTPYSQTGWPLVSPEWWVFATDVMHRVDLGVDCNVLFGYWLAEARAGRLPWVKYLNWQGKQWRAAGYGGETVAFRTAWANSGHYDHIHISARTDHRTTSLGAWSITPTTGDDMYEQYDRDRVNNASQNSFAILGAVNAGFAADATRDAATLAAFKALTAGGTSVDTAAVVTAVNAVRDEARAQFAALHTELAETKAALAAKEDELRQVLAAAAQAEADRLKA